MLTAGGPFRVNARRLRDSERLHLGPDEDGLRGAAGDAKLLVFRAAASKRTGTGKPSPRHGEAQYPARLRARPGSRSAGASICLPARPAANWLGLGRRRRPTNSGWWLPTNQLSEGWLVTAQLPRPDPEPEPTLPKVPLPLDFLNLARNGVATRSAPLVAEDAGLGAAAALLLTNQPQKVGWSALIAPSWWVENRRRRIREPRLRRAGCAARRP